MVDGSPGPFEIKTPSGLSARISAKVVLAGNTCTSIPRVAIERGVAALIPRSNAATVNFFSPIAGTT